MRWKRAIARTISEISALQRGQSAPRSGFRIMLYQAVGSPLSRDPYGISIKPELFERHMKILAQNTDAHLVPFADGCAVDSAFRVAVTFDDGYRDNLHTAAPVLLKFRIPFTVFVVSSFLKQQDSDYLTPSELRELAALPGATIGSHGATHLQLAKCDDATLWRELHESKCEIEDMLGVPVTGIAYPHGSVDLRVRDATARAGYLTGGCSRFDINDQSRDPLLLSRREVVAADSERTFLQKLYGAWDWYRWRMPDPARAE
ncbi:MAG: polysaccharide deacetylase family protein [Acidobacteria bacterium]|nr:polysaccharide deacetylase family protein [Acidobacteriota bacterium]